MSWLEGLIAVLGLALITLLTRSLFLLPDRELPLPGWLQQGLRYVPLAALVAVVAPEIFSTQGRMIDTWHDARLPAALAATGWYFWRRGILGTIVVGTLVLLAFKLGLGW